MTAKNPFTAWAELFQMGPGFSDLGPASTEMMSAWAKAWQAAFTGRALPAVDLMNPATWGTGGQNIADAFETALGTPQWSDLMSVDSETLKRFAPAVDLALVGQEYAVAVAQVSSQVVSEFQKRLAAKGGRLDGSGAALDLWNDTLDEVLVAFNRSETFADLQRRFLRALMGFRLEERWAANRLAEHYHLPTREEVDEITRRVHDLERENRRLRRAIQSKTPARSKP